MAYNRPSNGDELPSFPEPERAASHSRPGPSSRYESKPPPPLPQSYGSSSHHDPRAGGGGGGVGAGGGGGAGGGEAGRYQGPQHVYASPSPMSPPAPSGQRPPPPHNRPAAQSGPPPSPSPAPQADRSLQPLFKAVDKDGTGQLSERELSAALVNGDWSSFDPQTVRMMIRMFDSDRSGTIGYDEFCGLWSFLASWRTLFDRFDTDRSGNISLEEFSNALIAFRYRLTPGFVRMLFATYDKRGEGVMSFDLFVQACISLKRMTDVFKKYDDDRDGYITLSFEDFLIEILKQLK